MITKAELDKMVEEAAYKYSPSSKIMREYFKSGASFVTVILMDEISDLEDQVYHATRGKANSEYLLNQEIQSLKDENGRLKIVNSAMIDTPSFNKMSDELSTLTAKVNRYENELKYISQLKSENARYREALLSISIPDPVVFDGMMAYSYKMIAREALKGTE